jgi:aminoglycoside 6'-N-acetyltransferase I
MTIAISPVQRHQFDDWLALRDAVYTGLDREFHRQEMEQISSDRQMQCLLAVAGSGEVCGMIELSLRNVVDGCLTSPVGYVEGLYVTPRFRGTGISRRLLESAEAWFRGQGCREMATDAELGNEAAQQFHRHMGFQETYRIVEYRRPLEDLRSGEGGGTTQSVPHDAS